MRIPSHQTLDLGQALQHFDILHRQVAQTCGRIIITHEGGECCVLLSKTELDALEQAIEILGKTEDVQALCRSLQALGQFCAADPSLPLAPA